MLFPATALPNHFGCCAWCACGSFLLYHKRRKIARATPHKARLTALHAICVQIFRHIAQEKIYRRIPAVSGKNRLLSMCIFPTVYSSIAIAVQIAADCIVINRIFFMRSLHILTGISGSILLRSARTMPYLQRHKFFCLHIIIHNNCQNYNTFLCIVIKL